MYIAVIITTIIFKRKMFKFYLFYWGVLWKCIFCMCADIYEYVGLSTVELIKKNRYPVEIYSDVVTEDNYLLDIYRIPHGRFETKGFGNPIILMHGTWRSSEDYVVMGTEKGLAYLLADRGYDVWLPNARGTIHSRKHLTLNPDSDADFWAFSWHEIGLYDLSATFKLIRNVTKKNRLSYIGISEGTTVFYVLTSMRPEYNSYVNLMISLAPVAYQTHIYSPIARFVSRFEPILTTLAEMLSLYEAGLPVQIFQMIGRVICTIEGFLQEICVQLLFQGGGYSLYLNRTMIPIFLGINATGGMRQFLHYAQNVNSGLFRQYNFGRRINLEKYGTLQPPSYNLGSITSPMALIYSNDDWLSHPLDAERICAEVVNCVYIYKVPLPQFNHFDFLTANNVVDVVFENIFCILEKYNNNITKNCK